MQAASIICWKERILAQAILAVFPFILVLSFILYATHGHFTYTLDDPYIHIALAKNIWLGTYGINLGEPSAPSSSILWPFLLAPCSSLGGLLEYMPLAINMGCLCALVYVIDLMFADVKFPLRLLFAFLILFSLNAYGLVFTGMEHSLQILLIALILLPFLKKNQSFSGQATTPAYAIAALILLPLIRYEGLAISMPMLGYLFLKGERGEASLAMGLLMSLVLGFSLFLHAKGLGFLPSSVLAKSGYSTGLYSVVGNLLDNFRKYGFLTIPIAIILTGFWRKDRLWFWVILCATLLHFLFGKAGWFGRYEVYFLLFILLIGLRILINSGMNWFPAMLCLPITFYSLAIPIIQTPLAASNIYNQQAKMAMIANKLGEPVAVNDLGLMAWRSGRYILDLWGLGSIEALHDRLSQNSPDWINLLMAKKSVKYAFIYDNWFKQKPANWIKVGGLFLNQTLITPGADTVALYAADSASADKLRAVLTPFMAQSDSSSQSIVLIYPNATGQASNSHQK